MRAATSHQRALERMLNKHTPTPPGLIRIFHTFSADQLLYCTHCLAVECDINYSPPIALFVDDADSD